MNMRYISSAPIGIAVTALLLYTMQLLIEIGPEVLVDVKDHGTLSIVRIKRDEVIRPDSPTPDFVKDTELPPLNPPVNDIGDLTSVIGVGLPQPPPPRGIGSIDKITYSDGALVNIIKVQPQYPVRASERGLEGYVDIRFDVTVIGTVENVEVVRSTNTIFEKSAVDAALRFRYRPRVVDGVPLGTQGLMNRFVYRMDNL